MFTGSVFDTYSFDQIMQYSVAMVIFLAMIIAVLFAIWWGFLMVISAWNEEKVKAAVNHIRYAALGIGVLVVILFVAPMFLNFFGLPYGEYFRPNVILHTIRDISTHIFWGSATPLYDGNNVINVSTAPDFSTLQ